MFGQIVKKKKIRDFGKVTGERPATFKPIAIQTQLH
jgi:hypothetical protein